MTVLTRAYRTIDTRALSAFRIAMGSLCIADLIRRVNTLELYYVRGGWVPSDLEARYTFTLLDWCTNLEQAYGLSVLALIAAFCFTIGFQTKLAHGITWLCLISFHSSRFPTVNTGDLVMHLFIMWTLWLPLDRHWSVDAWRRAGRHPPPAQTVSSLAVTACWLQLATIYGFGALEKWGPNWWNGEAFYYAMHLDMFATPLALALRDEMPMALSEGLTAMTLCIEFLAPLLILSPTRTTACRRLAAGLLTCLHLGIALMVEIGLFPYVMFATFTLLIFPTPSRASPEPSGRGRWVTEGAVTIVLIINIAQGLVSHELPRDLIRALGGSPSTPELFREAVYAGRMTQRWRLFAPSVPAGEGRLVLDGRGEDETRLDPMTGEAPDFGPSSARVHVFDQQWRKYSARAKSDDSGRFARQLAQWWLAERRELQSIQVYWVYDRSPEPGQSGGAEVIRIKHLGGWPPNGSNQDLSP